MKIDNPTGDPECHKGAYTVRFEERQVEDIRFPVDRDAFERVRTVSGQLDAIYSGTLSKWIQATTNPITTAAMEWLHPMRVERYMFGSSFNPFMHFFAAAASTIRTDRHALSEDAPLRKLEAATFGAVHDALTRGRTIRDDSLERLFDRLYGSRAAQGDGTEKAGVRTEVELPVRPTRKDGAR